MQSNSHSRLLTYMNLISNVLPFYGYADQCNTLMTRLCKTSNLAWKENEKPLLTIVLKENKRKIVLSSNHYENADFMQYLLKYFKVKLTELKQRS